MGDSAVQGSNSDAYQQEKTINNTQDRKRSLGRMEVADDDVFLESRDEASDAEGHGHGSMSGHLLGVAGFVNEKKDAIGKAEIHFFLLITLVMACRMIVPAFSISFFVRPMVTHTFRAAGTTCLGWKLSSRVLRRVIRTPLARHYREACQSNREMRKETRQVS